MLTQTHRLIAAAVHDQIQLLTGVTIDWQSFQYGAIAPDLHPHLFFGMKHYRESSQPFVLKQMADIQTQTWKGYDQKRLAYKLGIVCHFLADYHCYPHVYYSLFTDDFRTHFAYEVDLHATMKAMGNLHLAIRLRETPIDVSKMLATYAEWYHATPHSAEKDLRFAVGVGAQLLSELVQTIKIQ